MFKINSKNVLRFAIVGLGVLLVIIALAIAGSKVASQEKPNESPVEKKKKNSSFTVEYNIVQSETQGAHYVVDSEIGKTVFDVLKKIASENTFDLKYNNNYSFGVFIESIVGIKNGDDGKYWQYYINGTLGDVAADKKELKAGDKVEWRFEKVPEF